MATAYDEDHSISSSQHDDTDDRRSTIPAASADEKPFPFFGLLCYADKVDWLLMALGTVGSAIHGMAFPIGYLLLGKALDAFLNLGCIGLQLLLTPLFFLLDA